jgi:hypothetical protein
MLSHTTYTLPKSPQNPRHRIGQKQAIGELINPVSTSGIVESSWIHETRRLRGLQSPVIHKVMPRSVRHQGKKVVSGDATSGQIRDLIGFGKLVWIYFLWVRAWLRLYPRINTTLTDHKKD